MTITARYNFFVCLSIGAKCCLLKRSQQKLILEKAYSVPLVHCISIPNRLDNSTAHLTLGFPWIEEVSLEQVIHYFDTTNFVYIRDTTAIRTNRNGCANLPRQISAGASRSLAISSDTQHRQPLAWGRCARFQ